MELEQSQNFNERLSQWVANQGFWFQIRYSMTGTGTKGTAMFHLLRLSFRILIFMLVLAVGTGVYLVKRTGSVKFNEALQEALQEGMTASEAEMVGFQRVQGALEINRLSFKGGNETFFNTMVVRNIRCKMGLLDGLFGKWDPGTISVFKLDMDLRAGADDADSSQMIAKALFKSTKKILIKSVEIQDATVRWGYSERTWGSIDNSALKILRQEDGMKLIFKGGTLSQNWLHKLEIVDLEIACDKDGVTFEKAELRHKKGTVVFSGLRVTGGSRPLVEGTAKIHRLDIESIVPPTLRNFIEGSISGDFRVTGSTNSADGLGFSGQVTLDGQDIISLRDRVHLLKALSTVDYVRNYHRVDFREGAFHLKTIGGGMEITDLKFKQEELLSLEGKLLVRLPTPAETKAAMEKSATPGGAPLFSADETDVEKIEPKGEEAEFTLRRAAEEAKRAREGSVSDGSNSLFDRLGMSLEMRRLEMLAADRLSRTLRYEGGFKITLPPDAFDRAPRLAAQYPVDPKLGRIPMVVPIEGSLYEVTLKQAEDLYQQGRR